MFVELRKFRAIRISYYSFLLYTKGFAIMYFAICDDNIADRKQSERLLKRQAERVIKESGEQIYIDSFGNKEAFMIRPQMYQALFIDMTLEETNGFVIAKTLLDIGITKPIILCCSSIDYRKLADDEGLKANNLYFIDKPIKVEELTEFVDRIVAERIAPPSTVELRYHGDTIYASGDDIVCAKKKGENLLVYLADGRILTFVTSVFNFYDQCSIFPQICPVSNDGLININHVRKSSSLRITMDNGISFFVAFYYSKIVRQAIEDSKKQ